MDGEIIRAIAATLTQAHDANAMTVAVATIAIEATAARAGSATRAAAERKVAMRVVAREAARATVPPNAVEIARDQEVRVDKIRAVASSKAPGIQTAALTQVPAQTRTAAPIRVAASTQVPARTRVAAPIRVAASTRVLVQTRAAAPIKVAASSKAIVAIKLADPTRASSATTSATVPKMADRTLAETAPQAAIARIAVVANVVAEEDAAAADAVVAAGAKVGIARVPRKVVPPRMQAVTAVVDQRTHLRRRLHLCRRVTVATIITTRVGGMKAGLMRVQRSHRGRKSRARLQNT
jgi:hypothetical protein